MNQIDYAPYQSDYMRAFIGTSAAVVALGNNL
jgi:hypothetical protein